MNQPIPVEVAEGVWSIRTTGSWALAVNSFLIRRDGALVLVDTGFPTANEALFGGLRALGVEPDELDTVLYTHTHPDHMGGGVAAGEALGGDHVFWSGTVPALGNYWEFYDALPSWREWLGALLPLGPRRDAVLQLFPRRDPSPRPGTGELPRRSPVEFGSTRAVGGLRFECVDARGHDPYHVAWLEPRLGWLFSGDVLLTNPTPLLPILRDDLPQYRATVHRWARSLSPSVLFPGHGRPTERFAEAAARSCAHTRDLYSAVADLLAGGPFDPGSLLEDLADAKPGEVRRSFITIAAAASQLTELESLGVAQRGADGLWRQIAPLPPFEARIQA
ncbi:MAG: MBL fold metallo-hydrolase [Myxococcales bacterium]|nr:MBL fold metallo-hydrolase [Myxococcales bacterium]MCB9520944.1 MBL fold metallo-hydrolase [Myxococcales bacterium]MCB9531692.1 MBL fold metallo-hydrolase [Myxococcales bacterium]MCB9534421.1 MBL fold metallo-hydrolase [Myxococcales bacterium]